MALEMGLKRHMQLPRRTRCRTRCRRQQLRTHMILLTLCLPLVYLLCQCHLWMASGRPQLNQRRSLQ